LVVPAGLAAYLSFSRGAWLAFFVGLAVLLLVAPRRLVLLVTLAICGAAVAVALLRLRGYDALTGDPTLGDGRAAEGRAFAPLVLGMAGAAGAVQCALAWFRPHPEAAARLSFLGRRAAAVIGALVVIAGGVVYLTHTDRAEGTAAARLVAADSWVSRQWRDFMNPATFTEAGSGRLTTARGTRSDLFRVAIDGFDTHPLRGDGSGGFEVRFAHDRRVQETVRDAHSLYLETLGELGLVGALLLVGLIGSFGWAAVVARLRPRAMSRAPAAAASAGLAVWAAHCIVDWDWQMPALTALALMLAAALMPTGISRRRRTPDPMRF
jgi:O-antigen ligase